MINVLFCGNEGVFDGFLTSTLSILERSEYKGPYTFYVYTLDVSHLNPKYVPISDKSIDFLNDIVVGYHYQNKVIKVDVTDIYMKEFAGSPNEKCYCSPYTLLRLFADLVPNMPDKILYLDADIMFNKDIRLLYDIDVNEFEYAASRDHYGKFLINPNYINAGVLLFNLKKMKETKILEKARNLIRTKKLMFADQSALIRSTSKRKVLPQKFNDKKFLKKSTVIRHFSKRLFWLPYPHTDNIKQWDVVKLHQVFKYHQFDDILGEYIDLKQIYRSEYYA